MSSIGHNVSSITRVLGVLVVGVEVLVEEDEVVLEVELDDVLETAAEEEDDAEIDGDEEETDEVLVTDDDCAIEVVVLEVLF